MRKDVLGIAVSPEESERVYARAKQLNISVSSLLYSILHRETLAFTELKPARNSTQRVHRYPVKSKVEA